MNSGLLFSYQMQYVLGDTSLLDTNEDIGAAMITSWGAMQTNKIVAGVGAAASGVTAAVASLMSALSIPLISYSATAAALSNKVCAQELCFLPPRLLHVQLALVPACACSYSLCACACLYASV